MQGRGLLALPAGVRRTDRWQRMEQEADEDVAAGNVRTHQSGGDFLAHLDSLETDD